MSSDTTTIYKIEMGETWRAATVAGIYEGSADDVRDGFIHFSTAEQLAGTAEKFFRNRHGLVLIAFDAPGLGRALRWEPSRGGALFPHLYAHLDPTRASGIAPLPLRADGIPDVETAKAALAAEPEA